MKNGVRFRPGDLVRLESEILSDDMECTANLWGESTYVGVPIGEWTGRDVGIILDSKEEHLQESQDLVWWTSYRVLVGLVVGWIDSRDVVKIL